MIGKMHFGIFRKFLISYLFFLVISLLSGMTYYWVADNVITKSSEKLSLMLLDQNKDLMDHLMEGIQKLSKEISLNDDINIFVNANDTVNLVYNTWKAWKSFSPYNFSDDGILSFYIYSKKNNMILTPSGPYVRPEDYYGLFHYSNMNLDQWKQSVLGNIHTDEILPLQPFIDHGQEVKVITYMSSITFGHEAATLVVLIDGRELQKLLSRNTLDYGGWVNVIDAKGQTIASYGDLPENPGINSGVKHPGTIIIKTRSDYDGWTYVAGLPKDKVLEKAIQVRNTMLYIVSITTVISLIVALLLSYRNSVPLNELVAILREYFDSAGYKGKNGFDFLRGNIAQLIRDHQSFGEELNKRLPVLSEAYIGRLLKGELSENEGQDVFEQLGIRFCGEYGYVCILHIHGFNQLDQKEYINQINVSRIIIRKVLNERFGSNTVTGDDNMNQLSVIWTSPSQPDQAMVSNLNATLQKTISFLSNQYNVNISIAVGGVFHSLTNLYRSFYEAKQAMEYAIFSPLKITWYELIPKEIGSMYYPIDLEVRIMNAIKTGERSEVKSIMERINEENLLVRQVSGEMFRQLIYEIKGTAYKIIAHKRSSEQLERQYELLHQIDPFGSPVTVWEAVEKLFDSLCDNDSYRKNGNEKELADRMTQFLQANYYSSLLCLSMVSEQFQLPEKYISQMFKEQTGEYFSAYLEKIRIQHATELLLKGELTIDQIANKVGYNSANAFRRAFKRVSGASPSQFRSLLAQNVNLL